jgi:hypothetical protein
VYENLGGFMVQGLTDETIEKIENDLILLKSRHNKITSKLVQVNDSLKNAKAKEFLFHGILRRINTIARCVDNIYSIFPVSRKKLLCSDQLNDIAINLHAFFINIFGLLDNMAWVVAHENQFAEKIGKRAVGLYSSKFQSYVGDAKFIKYLNSDRMRDWHNKYLKDYRDALSHQIPLYVPPKFLTPDEIEQIQVIEQKISEAIKNQNFDEVDKLRKKEDEMGQVASCFTHSLSRSNRKDMVLHVQVITDFGTIEQIVENFCAMFEHGHN